MTKYTIRKVNLQEENLPEMKYIKMVKQRNIIDVTKLSVRPRPHIKKVSKTEYMVGKYNKHGEFISDGEVLSMSKNNGKMRNRRSLRKIFVDLRQLIYTNFAGNYGEIFLTLTYEEQTNDPKQIHNDFRNFVDRLNRKWKDVEHIAIVEPHASGNFHIHMLVRSNVLPTAWYGRDMEDVGIELYHIWGNGFVKAEQLNSVDHIGAYFIAYFTNMELSDEEAEAYGEDVVEKNGKKYIKGLRLDFYPNYMKIYRKSKGIIKPVQGDFDLDGMRKTYESIVHVSDDEHLDMYVVKEQYKEDDD